MRVLVVEDEPRMADVIRRSLVREGFATDVAGDGDDAIWKASAVDYDAIVLDVMLPGKSGFDACRAMRDQGIWSPVLMLTARDAVRDRVAGLDSGADDYLVKPFAIAELLARLRSLIRRGALERPTTLTAGDLELDPARHEVHRRGHPIELTAKEFTVLEVLMRRRNEVVTRLDLIEHAWDLAYEIRSNIVDAYIRRLRDKVDRPFGVDTLETVRGVGYRLRDR
jgi:two-component system, OmpR family, response regulator